MTIAGVAVKPEFRVGRVLDDSFRALRSNLVPLLVLPMLSWSPAFLAVSIVMLGEVDQNSAIFQVSGFLIALASLVLCVIARAAVIYGTFRHLQGRSCEIRDCVAMGQRGAWKLFAVAFVSALLVGFGYAFFFVPGFYLETSYWAVEPVAVVERTRLGACLRRSSDLAIGHRWRIFGIVLICGVAELFLQLVQAILPPSGSLPTILFCLIWWVATSSYFAFDAIVRAVSYYHLRQAKEGIDIDQIAAVFD